LQYMAAGLPVVANPVGMNREMVVHGRTGYLAETEAEWSAAIARLAANPELRQQMGEAGRSLVRERYSVERWSAEFAALVDRLPQGAASTLPLPQRFPAPPAKSGNRHVEHAA